MAVNNPDRGGERVLPLMDTPIGAKLFGSLQEAFLIQKGLFVESAPTK